MSTSRNAFAIGFLASTVALLGCQSAAPEPSGSTRPTTSAEPVEPEPTDLVKEDEKVGEGVEAKEGDKVKVNYTGRLKKTNFTFDTSLGPGKKPFEFTIGKGQVIKGWDQGVLGMKVGGKRKLTIPAKLGYGDKGQPPKIPGKSTLVFEVELLSVEDAATAASASASASAAPSDEPPKKKKRKKK